jgi:hypothetical protein
MIKLLLVFPSEIGEEEVVAVVSIYPAQKVQRR